MRGKSCLLYFLALLYICSSAGVWSFSLGGPASVGKFISTGSSDLGAKKVLQLPGLQGGFPSQHYAGYVTVDDATGRQLYYYLVTHEARDESSPRDVPLIIWLTGGPGCSSMDAFTYENGPFVFTAPEADVAQRDATVEDIKLHPNPHSWSQSAHVLYIDSPAGTGFSYTPGERSYSTNDDRTIDDLVTCVRGFFQQVPWLQQQPLYIAGESYGGVYVPLLARALLKHNQQKQQQQHAGSSSPAAAGAFNLAGYIVGNAVTDDRYDGAGQLEFAFGLGLIDPNTYSKVKQTCKANGWHAQPPSPCAHALEIMEGVMGPINQYDILGKCFKPPGSPTRTAAAQPSHAAPLTAQGQGADALLRPARKLQQQQQGAGGARLQAAASAGAGSRLRAVHRLRHAISCADRRLASVYYNSEVVRRAVHAASMQESGRWEPCSDILEYTQTAGSMIPVHRELLEAGVRGLVLSGDHDYVVPYTGTRAWVYDLRMPQAKPWHTWALPGDDQVAGYTVEFKGGLTFATVKGGGHMVPQTHPAAALALIQQWLAGQL